MSDEGLKFDDGKQPWHLLPWNAVNEVVKVLKMGAEKYGDNNWQKLGHFEVRYFAAAMRHLYAWNADCRMDGESGLSHLAHAAGCILFMLERELALVSNVGSKDRFHE